MENKTSSRNKILYIIELFENNKEVIVKSDEFIADLKNILSELDDLKQKDYNHFAYLKRIDNLEKSNKELQQENLELKIQLEDKSYEQVKIQMLVYKEIIEKAKEYIKEHQRKDEFLELNEWQSRDLLNILNGDDK